MINNVIKNIKLLNKIHYIILGDVSKKEKTLKFYKNKEYMKLLSKKQNF